MAEIRLTIKTNFSEAQKQIESIGATVESETKRMDTAMKKISSESIDAAIQKNQRLAAAVTATRGPVEGATVLQRNLRNEIERLVKNGMDPQSESMKKLESEYIKVSAEVEKNTQALKRNESVTKMVTVSQIAFVSAVGAATIALVKNALSVGKNVDAMSESAMALGMTTQEYQSLSFAAERSGTSMDTMASSVGKLNSSIGQARDGTGQLHKMLSDSNPALLEQLTNAESSSDAFLIMADAIAKTKNPFDRAALAGAAFGKGNREILNTINMAMSSDGGIPALAREAEKYGVVTDSLVEKSGKFDDSQKNAMAAINGVRYQLAEKMLPVITMVIQGFADFLSKIDNAWKVLGSIAPVIVGVAAALGTMLVLAKVVPLVFELGLAMKALFLLLAKNPIAVVIGIVTTAIVWMVFNWEKAVYYWEVGTSAIINGLAGLVDFIQSNLLGALGAVLGIFAKIPGVGKYFGAASDAVNSFSKEFSNVVSIAEQDSQVLIDAAYERMRVAEQEAEQAKNMRPYIPDISSEGGGYVPGSKGKKKTEDIGTGKEFSFSDKLMELQDAEKISMQQRIEAADQFYAARLEQGNVSSQNEIEFLMSQYELIKGMDTIYNEEKIAAEIALNERIAALRDEQIKADTEAFQARLETASSYVGGLSNLFTAMQQIAKNAGKESRAFAVIQKGIAIAQIAINTILGVSQILGKYGATPIGIGLMAITAATGIAAGVAAATTPIPSAETGTSESYVVPNSNRTDSSMMRVNQGEEVSVTPRGESRAKQMIVNVVMDSRVLFSQIQDGFDSGQLRVSTQNF